MLCLCRWNTYVVDGHDVEELCKAFWQAQQVKGKPTCIVAKTFKGKGLKSECCFFSNNSFKKCIFILFHLSQALICVSA